MTAPSVFLDACVLYPLLVRGILIGSAEQGLFRPRWSERVLDEWIIAVARRGAGEDIARSARTSMERRFPDAMTAPDPDSAAGLVLPDPADVHVAAAARQADILLTFNLRDFPRRKMTRMGVDVRHPDGFLWELWSHEPDTVESAIRLALEGAGIPLDARRGALKRARLSRLAKAMG